MFTGIVEEVGTVESAGARLRVRARRVVEDSGPGSSVAVNGACLTVVERDGERLCFDLSPETLARTALGRLEPGDPVNLERPLTLLSRLGGHLVQGHVDGVGEVRAVEEAPPGRWLWVGLPESLERYVALKGSVALDGVSLTVADLREGAFAVALVPYTLAATTLGRVRPGTLVNLEVDVVAKYVERLLGAGTGGRRT